MSRWTDLTRRLDDKLICWPGRRPPELRWEKRLDGGHHCNVSAWALNAHTGTHVDAPLHFMDKGSAIDEISLDVLTGPCEFADISAHSPQTFTADDVRPHRSVRRLLIRTGFGEDGRFSDHPPLIEPDAATELLDGGLCLIGTDRLSVDGSGGLDFSIHRLLLGNGCVIVEGLDLSKIVSGSYELCALPIRLAGAEASPARVIVRQTEAG